MLIDEPNPASHACYDGLANKENESTYASHIRQAGHASQFKQFSNDISENKAKAWPQPRAIQNKPHFDLEFCA
jgi:hypothetical protein